MSENHREIFFDSHCSSVVATVWGPAATSVFGQELRTPDDIVQDGAMRRCEM